MNLHFPAAGGKLQSQTHSVRLHETYMGAAGREKHHTCSTSPSLCFAAAARFAFAVCRTHLGIQSSTLQLREAGRSLLYLLAGDKENILTMLQHLTLCIDNPIFLPFSLECSLCLLELLEDNLTASATADCQGRLLLLFHFICVVNINRSPLYQPCSSKH